MASATEIVEMNRSVLVIDATLTSDTSGDATTTLPDNISGKLVQLQTQPQTLTADWDLTLVGSDVVVAGAGGVVADYLNSAGADRHTTTDELLTEADLGIWIGPNETLVLTGASMGSVKTAYIRIWILRIA